MILTTIDVHRRKGRTNLEEGNFFVILRITRQINYFLFRSSSSDSSDSRSRKKRDKKINEKHRSRSYDNRHSKSRRSRSLSRSRKSNRRYDRSRDRKSSNSSDRHRSTERRYKTKSRRSRSRSYIQEYSSKSRRRSSSSSSSSASSTTSTNIKKSSSTQRGKETKIIAQTVTIENKDNDKEPNISSNILDEINDDKFVQKKFSSNAKKVPENIVIDLRKQTIKVPEVEPIEPDTIYHHNVSTIIILPLL